MVAQRRFGPLIGIVFAGLGVLAVRLFQVQIVEHEVWSQQASGLVRSSRVLPSHRGSILDRNGVVLARDEDTYRIDFKYREFRRRHPLGILAHAYSSLEMRVVPLAAALQHRQAWTEALLRISPQDLDRFEAGDELTTKVLSVAKTETPNTEARARRAADLRYYVGELLALTKEDASFVRRLEDDARSPSYLEILARRRGLAVEALLARVNANVGRACEELSTLAGFLRVESRDERAGTVLAGGAALDRTIAFLEDVRANLEDESADDLFESAAGFDAGAISTESLATVFDLTWIARSLRWDEARLSAWIASRETRNQAQTAAIVLPRALVHVELETPPRRAERLLDEIALLYAPPNQRDRDEDGRPPSWRDLDDLAVLDQIPSLFEGTRMSSDSNVPDVVLPLQDRDLRDIVPDPADPWKIVGLVSDLAGKDGAADEPLREPIASETWTEFGRNRANLESPAVRVELTRLVRALDRRHRAAIDRLLSNLSSSIVHDDGSLPRLTFTESRRKRAQERDRYVQADRGNRPLRVLDEPDYELVQRIARNPELYRGFEVRDATKRVHPLVDADGEITANLLLGSVGKPLLRELMKQAGDETRLSELRFMVIRSDDEEHEMRVLAARVQRADEWSGSSGLEDYLDPELRGKPGWLQTEGLEERSRNDAGAEVVPPRDGLDVTLTLDVELQNAAQQVISHPKMPGGQTDRAFFESPVGAIALITLQGEVLAAASAPNTAEFPAIPGRDLERSVRRERTLQRPTFNPPGSVFKPFVAAYAIQQLGFDPARHFECRDMGKGRGGFETMHCTGIHGSSDLKRALTVSCNSYFAQVGLEYGADQAVAMTELFGFTQPTGIKSFGTTGRSGLREEVFSAKELARAMKSREAHMRFANGLTVLNVLPMQVARATAGLVTGSLPDVRIVKSVGTTAVEPAARPLGIDEKTLQFVASAMRDVVDSPDGSAHGKGLDVGTLGFDFACKTGSGDYLPFRDTPELSADDRRAMDAGKMRKHTWVAGWFPVDAPKAVLVVYLHDVSETSSHTAVYVAAQFLATDAVKKFVGGAAR
ncbi:MAG: penicillin-binding transpeptidase domain-containing protein [Planctomycetota bacterium]|nr:penicillin-binding transpeptidase domain-containing protein [Planctomycetota bacterium]